MPESDAHHIFTLFARIHLDGQVPPVGATEQTNTAGSADPISELPTIVCGSTDPGEGLKKWTPEAIDALARANRGQALGIYQRGGLLVRVRRAEPDAAPFLETLGHDTLRGLLDRSACWATECWTKKGLVLRYGPPLSDVVRDVLVLADYDRKAFPPLHTIVESPRFLPDGTLILTPGYHAAGKLYYDPPAHLRGLVVPLSPTAEDVQRAKGLILDDLLGDFPFLDQPSRANAVAFALLPFLREMINGATPNHHFDASTEGTGKGLCVDACTFPAVGDSLELTPQKESDAEWRKALTSSFMSGASHFFVDNITTCPLSSGALAAALTGRNWKDRLLGGNKDVRLRVQSIFASSGNNVTFSRELDRRSVRINLFARSENPSLLKGPDPGIPWKHDPLLEWARENHAALVAACLTLCCRWIAAGKPSGSQVMGSYREYARVMGGVLDCCGVQGFLGNQVQIVTINPEASRWNALISEWSSRHKTNLVSTAGVWDLIMKAEGLAERFYDLLRDGTHLSQKQRLGKALEANRGRVFTATLDETSSSWRLIRSEAVTADKNALWRLWPAAERLPEDAQPDPPLPEEDEPAHTSAIAPAPGVLDHRDLDDNPY
jgi:hypothetical protein